MSLRDQSCYTLELQQSPSDPAVVELVELDGTRRESRYARVREGKHGEAYSATVFDYMTAAKLASVGYETDRAKKRRLQLHGPDEDVAFDMTGKLNFEWTFQFQGHKFRWTKEVYGRDYVCSMDRKPDPKVEICLARGPDKGDPGRVQILHYNIERFPDEITDLRGLETLLVTSFMCFVDIQDDRWRPSPRNTVATPSAASSTDGKPLPVAPAEPVKQVTEEDFEPENPNEILVGLQTNLDDHIARACGLLMDPSVVFIVIRTRKAEAAQRALQVSLGVTRFRHREGLGDLHQYVIEEDDMLPAVPEAKSSKGPKVISLDDPKPEPRPETRKASGSKKPDWKPPSNIAIYLSTIDLPDLHPSRRRASNGGGTAPTSPTPAGLSRPDPAPSSSNAGGSGTKLSKKPTKGFPNPFASSASSSSPAPVPNPGKSTGGGPSKAQSQLLGSGTVSMPSPSVAPTLAPPPRLSSRPSSGSNASHGSSASPAPATSPRPPSPLPSHSGTAEQNQDGGVGKLSGLAKLIAISRK